MNAARLFSCFAACFVLTLIARPSNAQQPSSNPVAAACGSTDANYTVKHDDGSSMPTQPPPGKALVYVVEFMSDYPFITKKVNIGLDGTWLGATDAMTHISFTVDPGPHHLCAVYQGHAASMDNEGHTLLLHLDAQAGHIYYFRYHAMFWRQYPGIAFFDPVDEDEGQYLVQGTAGAISTLKNSRQAPQSTNRPSYAHNPNPGFEI
jgi:hypothetical protein